MRCSRVAVVAFLAVSIVASAALYAADQGDSKGDFYFSDGSKIVLVPSSDWVALRFDPAVAGPAEAVLPEAVDAHLGRHLAQHDLWLLPIPRSLSAEARDDLRAEIAASDDVRMVARVYRSDGALMIVTDELVVRFSSDLGEAQIVRMAEAHGAEVVRRFGTGPTFVLRVADRVALATANVMHRLADVEYAHPDFIRVLPPRPSEIRPDRGRIVVAPDGSLLPPDTPIEKGRNDLRIIEPASSVLPISPSTSQREAPSSVGRVTVRMEGFEGTFPGDWTLYGDPSWGAESYRAYAGSKSAYSVGSSVAPPGPYPSDTNSWLVYGPFDLSDAEDARVDFQAWIETESGYDYFAIMASTNGNNFYGYQYSGDLAGYFGGWVNMALDLKRVGSLGDLRGESQVWIAFIQNSDEIYNYEGVYVDEVVIEKITGGYTNLTNDEFDHLQWGLANNQQLWGVDGADVQAPDAWAVTLGSDAITIAVLDEGVDLMHPDLAGKMVPGYDATDGGGSGGPSGDDAHGTGCAGIAAAITDNSLGVAGLARLAKIMPVRVAYDDGNGNWVTSDSWLADAIDWAVANGADVLSNSWGGGSPATVLTEAIANAKSNGRGGLGSLVLFAAGNANGPVQYPARLDTVLAVAATSPCDERKAPTSCDGEYFWGSCFGPEIDIAAPGVHMYTTDISGAAGYDPGDYYYNFNGTSSATPMVAGVAALVLGQHPSIPAGRAEAHLLATADDLLTPGWDEGTGYGRVNAYRAVTEALPVCHQLTLGHSGQGADPTAAPTSSAGCPVDHYYAGSVVTLTASPAAEWTVGSWTGTDDDGSLSPTNTVTMPASAHAASVTYVEVPAGCFVLHRRHSGSGSDPVPTPWNSPGCPGGTYAAGYGISLEADPSTGWLVGGWTGTSDNASFKESNSVSMPASDHTVRARYVTPTLLKDIRPGPLGAFNREDYSLVSYTKPASVGSTLFFAANDGVHGMELWKSDGSDEGTVLVKDIWPGANDAFPWSTEMTWFNQEFAVVGDTVFFVARDGVHNYEVWKSDGTAAGTSMTKDIYDSWDELPQHLTAVNGTLFFSHTNGNDGVELWKSDGTAAGTVMVKDINPGAGDSNPTELAAFAGNLIFQADDGTNGKEPWISDGTPGGTVMLKNINPSGHSYSKEFQQMGSEVFFAADNGTIGSELWKSNGTESGTVLVKDISPEGYDVNWGSGAGPFTVVGDTLFFEARDSIGSQVNHGDELWKSDGTEAGTQLVKDIWPGWEMSNPTNLTNVDGMLMFKANTPDQGDWGGELWRSDGTEAGTVMVKDIYPNPNPINRWPKNLTEAGDTLLFAADDATHGFELWRSEGTEASTRLVKDVNPGEYAAVPDWIIDANGMVFFRAFQAGSGSEMWALVDPSNCKLLELSVTGMGAVPSAEPAQSVGCDPGFFEAGELVTLTAAPATGWEVTGWTGTDDDGSTSATNEVTMPGIEHEVTVHYGATPQIFADGFESGQTSAWSSVVPD